MFHPIADILHTGWLNGRHRPCRIANADDLGAFRPEPAQCHANAARWVRERPNFHVVEGWAVEGQGLFAKHSVVGDPAGNLLCVTLGPQGKSFAGFIVHRPAWSETSFVGLPPQVMTFALLVT